MMAMSAKPAETRDAISLGGSVGKLGDCMEERFSRQTRRKDDQVDVTLLRVASLMNSADGSFVAKSRRTIDHLLTFYYSPLGRLDALPEVARELKNLYKFNDILGHEYEEAARRILHRFPSCINPDQISMREGRHAVLSFLRPEIRLRDAAYMDESLPKLRRVADLANHDELFNAAIYGHLSFYANVFLDQGIRKTKSVSDSEPDCVLSFASLPRHRIIGNPVTRVEVWAGEDERRLKGKLFLKACSMGPDLFASRLLAGSGVFIPEIRTVWYNKPDGEEGEYGLMLDASHGPGIFYAFPLGKLDCLDQPTIAFLRPKALELSKALGHAFEICRLRGIQDRHPFNTWLMITDEGRLRISMIDMDLVGCYPSDVRLFQQEFASHLESIAAYLSISLIDIVSGTDATGEALKMIKASFIEGAAEANQADRRRDFKIAEEFEVYDGKPVGIFIREDSLAGHFLDSEAACLTYNALNGPARQRLIVGGPNSGRFRFNAGKAWEHGYSAQRAIKPKDFWEGVFTIADCHPVRSIVY